jgi:hypothetical protein
MFCFRIFVCFCGPCRTHWGGIVNLEKSCIFLLVRFLSSLSGCLINVHIHLYILEFFFYSRFISERFISSLLFPLTEIGYCRHSHTFILIIFESNLILKYIFFIVRNILSTRFADHSSRAVEGMNNLLPLESWDHVFESHSRHRCACVHLFCVCIGRGLSMGWSPVQGVLPTLCRLRSWKSGQCPQGM